MKNIYVLLQLLGLIGLVFFPIGTLLGIILSFCVVFLFSQNDGFAYDIGSPKSEQGKFRLTAHNGTLYRINTETGAIYVWGTEQPDILYNWYELK